MQPRHRAEVAIAAALALAACQSGGGEPGVPGDSADKQPFGAIGRNEIVKFTGTEPFWGGEVKGTALTYTTPEDMEGETITVERFAGRGGLSFSGMLGGEPFDMMVTQAECSDGMSDRTYPFTVTLEVAGGNRQGCAWSEASPYTGPESP